MTERPATEAVVTVDAAGRYVDANAEALELLGVSLAELRGSPPDRFAIRPRSDAERAAFRREWERGGSHPVVGTASLRRADGTPIRVAFAIERTEAGFQTRFWHVEGSPGAEPSLFTVSEVLREWRAAERVLAELVPGTDEWHRMLTETDVLRGLYQELFSLVLPRPRDT